jgi:hypothetical protein
MARAGTKAHPYLYPTVLAIAVIATLASLPLMSSGARADAVSCASAQATATADGQAVTNLLDQLDTATTNQAQDKAKVGQLSSQVTDDEHLIAGYITLQTATDNATKTLQGALKETIRSVGADIRQQPIDHAQEIALEQIEAGAQGQVKYTESLLDLMRITGADPLQNPEFLAQADQAELATVLDEMAAPVLKGLAYFGYAVLAAEAGTLTGDNIVLWTDLNRLDSMHAGYTKANGEIDGLRTRLKDARAQLATDEGKVAALETSEAAAKATWMQATAAATAACQSTATSTSSGPPPPSPTVTPSG